MSLKSHTGSFLQLLPASMLLSLPNYHVVGSYKQVLSSNVANLNEGEALLYFCSPTSDSFPCFMFFLPSFTPRPSKPAQM